MKKVSLLPLKLLFSVLCLGLFTPASSATVKGRIKDVKTGESLIGVNVYLKENNKINTVSGLDGSYSLTDVEPGSYTLVAQFFSYVIQEKSITLTNATDEIVQNFSLHPDSLMLQEVQITGSYDNEGDIYARNLEKNNDYILNVVSARTMQLLPDITVGDVLQRVSGVVTEKSITGGGKFATIRGLDKRYSYATVNGIKMPSPDYNNQYVPLDLFPSQLLSRLEVIKTLRPDMEGDAIGGVMNLVLKSPPDYLSLNAEAAGGYNQNALNQSFQTYNSSAINSKSPYAIFGPNYNATPSDFPTQPFTYTPLKVAPDYSAGFTFGDRYFDNKLGVILSALYENDYSITKAFFITPDAQPLPTNGPNTPVFDDIEDRVYYTQQTRYDANLKLDYNLSPKHKISFYTFYVAMNQYKTEFRTDTALGTGSGAGVTNQNYVTWTTLESIYNATLQGQDSLLPNLYFDWTAAYSRGFSNTPDWGTLSTANAGPGTDVFTYSSWSGRWWQNTDEDYSGYANLTYKATILGTDVKFKVGAMNRDKNRVDEYTDYSLSLGPTSPSVIYTPTNLSDDIWTISGGANGSPHNGNNYWVAEDVTAIYGMVNFSVWRFDFMGGLRGENTLLSYISQLTPEIAGQYGDIHYIDYLPSGEIKYNITRKQAIRASYFSSITLPNFEELMPYDIPGEYYTEVGNPELLHTQAQNYDLRYEFFPNPNDELLAGVFYKNLIDPIEYTIVRYKASTQYLEPINDTNKAFSYGLELQFVYTITRNFKVAGNYTYNKSQTTVPDQYYATEVPVTRDETRPLQGQANDIGNLSVIYDDAKMGLKVIVAGVYTGKLIYAASPDYGLDLWQLPQERLDLSFEKRLSKKIKLSIFGKVTNILNTPLEIYEYPPSPYNNVGFSAYLPNQSAGVYINSILQEKETYGQTYWLGIRYNFNR